MKAGEDGGFDKQGETRNDKSVSSMAGASQDKSSGYRRQSRKTGISVSVVVSAFLFLLVITCPDKDKHCEAVQNALKTEASSKVVSKNWFVRQVSGLITSVVVTKPRVDTWLQYHNYFLFSFCTVVDTDGDTVVSYGFLNQVCCRL